MNQSNPVALITGAARRIGAMITQHLHQAGYFVVIHCHHSIHEAKALASRLNQLRPDSACVIQADLSQQMNAEQLMLDTLNWHKRLDLLVNNASLFIATPLGSFDDVSWEALFTIHVKAPWWLSNAAFKSLQASRGSIVNITDTHTTKPLKNYAVYCQSKAALAMQTKLLASEFSPLVRVNAVAPGAICWPEGANQLSEEQQQSIINKTLLKRHGDPLFIAQAVLALATNGFITGQTLTVDGGKF